MVTEAGFLGIQVRGQMGSGGTILAQTGPLEPHREQCSLQGVHLSVLAFSEDCNRGSASSSQDMINVSSHQSRNILRSQRGELRTKPLCWEMEKKPFHLMDWREVPTKGRKSINDSSCH